VLLEYDLRGDRISARTSGDHLRISQGVSGGQIVSMTYTRVVTGLFKEKYSYDGLGRLLSVDQVVETTTNGTSQSTTDVRTATRSYDAASREILSITYALEPGDNSASSLDTTATQTEYDDIGRTKRQTTTVNGLMRTRITFGDAQFFNASQALVTSSTLREYVFARAVRYGVSGSASSSNIIRTGTNLGQAAATTLRIVPKHWSGTGWDAVGNLIGYKVEVFDDSTGKFLYYTNHQIDYRFGETYQTIGESTKSKGKNRPLAGLTSRTYNVNGELVQITDKEAQKNNRYFANDANGNALTVVNGKFDGRSGRLSVTRAFDNALTRTGNKVKAQYFFFSNGQNIGTFGQLADSEGHVKANFDINFTPVSDTFASQAPPEIVTQSGDTLRSLAARLYGDANLWYVIAEENGLTDPDSPLAAGTQLTIPNKVFALSNAFDSFAPFDAAGLYNMTPTPKPLKASGLASAFAKVVGYIIQAIVTFYAGQVAGAAAGAAATNYLTQLFARMENGLYDWGAMAEGSLEGLGLRDLYDGSFVDNINPFSKNKVNAFVEQRRAMLNQMNGTSMVEFFKNNGEKSNNFEMAWIDPLAMGMRDYPIDYTSVLISGAAGAAAGAVTYGLGSGYAATALSSVVGYGTNVGLNRLAGRDVEWSWRDVAASALTAVATKGAGQGVNYLGGSSLMQTVAGVAARASVTKLLGGKLDAVDIATDIFLIPLANSLVEKTLQPHAYAPANEADDNLEEIQQSIQKTVEELDRNPASHLLDLEAPSNPDFHDADLTSDRPENVHVVEPGDTLWSIAREAYGEGAQWTRIADVNAVASPWTIRPGQEISIPAEIGTVDRYAQLALIQNTEPLSAADFESFVNSNLKHDVMRGENGETLGAPPPKELLSALRDYADSPIGSTVLGFAVKDNRDVKFTQLASGTDAHAKGEPGETQIFYSLGRMRVDSQNKLAGDAVESLTLAGVISHEIGHTALARVALDLPALKRTAGSTVVEEDGFSTVVFFTLPDEELRASALFENSYRQWKGLELRRSYFTENDVLNYDWNRRQK
jgi:nucleoid-associated protein YgaU